MEVLFIIGLPASGKTTLAKQICERTNAVLYDDPLNYKAIALHDKIVITDALLCREENVAIATAILQKIGYSKFDFIYFENDPDTCLVNAQIRNTHQVSVSIRTHTKHYKPINPIPCYKGN
jgi:cytidylate kinase